MINLKTSSIQHALAGHPKNSQLAAARRVASPPRQQRMNLVLLIGKHSMKDPIDSDIIVYH